MTRNNNNKKRMGLFRYIYIQRDSDDDDKLSLYFRCNREEAATASKKEHLYLIISFLISSPQLSNPKQTIS